MFIKVYELNHTMAQNNQQPLTAFFLPSILSNGRPNAQKCGTIILQ